MEKEEYLMIREEILSCLANESKYKMYLFTFTFAFFAFTFNQNNPLLFLLPFTIIIPLYLLSIDSAKAAMRLGAYLYVFLEPRCNIKWETNLCEYHNINDNSVNSDELDKSIMSPYMCISLLCIVLSVCSMDISNMKTIVVVFYLVIQITLTILCIHFFIINRINYHKLRIKYIENWERVKLFQESNSHQNLMTVNI